ncbi:ATP-dependent Clp protease ATP-binding subunit [Candidatus Uhrbacteria bacterium]|nr:ATP-dependent Clp protease ATP-binding subunit [Candidatus Uhrbacteria bacterium]
MDIVSKFTTHLKDVLTRSLCFTVDNNGNDVQPEHFLWALYKQQGSVASHILEKAGVTEAAIEQLALSASKSNPSISSKVPPLSSQARKTIEKAVLTANIYDHRHVGTEHLLTSLLQLTHSPLQDFFTDQSIETDSLLRHVSMLLKTTTLFPELDRLVPPTSLLPQPDKLHGEFPGENLEEEEEASALEDFAHELTTPEALKRVTPVIGREHEIERMTHILSRRTKSNPILIGEPGVGKTAIVEGLARKIVEKKIDGALAGKRIFQVDLASLIAGTMYRGEFEARLRSLIDEVSQTNDIILFIDEVHTIMGAGSASGSLDAANILKLALARGTIRCIGATTPAEYKKFIESDGAVERRFQKVLVDEPTIDQTRIILEGIQPTYEQFHNVRFNTEAVEAILTLAQRYLTTEHFPDKAIDLMDETGASMGARGKGDTPITATEDNVRETVMRIRGITPEDLAAQEKQKVDDLRRKLSLKIIGQDRVIDEVARVITRPRWRESVRPRASFLFAGPSGVGKTELAKIMAKTILPHKDSLLRLDMSEYREAYSASKLLGSPAGYVGYRDTNVLTDHLKHHPASLILFDEMEKAHPDIQHLLLQILEEGEIRDATGKMISFTQSIIVITTNVGQERFERGTLGFSSDDTWSKQDVRADLDNIFKIELLNRLDRVCLFSPLSTKHSTAIIKQQLAPILEHLKETGLAIDIDTSVYKYIRDRVSKKEGARGLLRVIEQEIEPVLLKKESGTLKAGKSGLRLQSER